MSNSYTAASGGASTVNGTSFGALAGLYTAGQVTVSASAMAGHLGTNISRGLPALGETVKAASNGAYEAALRLRYNVLSGPRFFVAPYVSASFLHTGLGSAIEVSAGILDL